eukprot:m.497508 g.497508  ORF g.497508 m.497508 type:complete len:769 (-) comp51365_c0_seq1:88-2394(-)
MAPPDKVLRVGTAWRSFLLAASVSCQLMTVLLLAAASVDFHPAEWADTSSYRFHNAVGDVVLCTVVVWAAGVTVAILGRQPPGGLAVAAEASLVVCAAGNAVLAVFKVAFGIVKHTHVVEFWVCVGFTLCFSALVLVQAAKLRSIPLGYHDGTGLVHGEAHKGQGSDGSDTEQRKIPKIPPRVTIQRLLTLSRPDAVLLTSASVCLVIAALTQVAVPHFVGQVVDYGAIVRDEEKFRRGLLLLAGAVLACAIFTGLRGSQFSLAIARLKVRLRKLLFARIIAQEIGFFDSQKTGEITSRLSADTTKMGDAIGNNLNVCLRAIVQIIGLLAFMSFLSWKLSLMTFTCVPVVVAVSKVYGEYLRKLSKKTQESVAASNDVADELVSTIKTVRCFAAEGPETTRFNATLADFYSLQRKAAFAYCGYAIVLSLLPNTVTILLLVYGSHLVSKHELTGGQLVTFLLYQVSLSDAFALLGYVYTALSEAFGAADKVFELVDREPELPLAGHFSPPCYHSVDGRIDFDNVTFRYPARPEATVLADFNLTVHSGEVVALVGRSGGGKSTIVSLLERLYDPTRGSVLLDGVKVSEYEPKALHRIISVVSQEPVLHARSIKDNIVFGLEDDEASMAEIVQAATQANAHEFISAFPDGYETQVGERGVSLSGGQRQRISLARALVRNPRVLLLDEATSALDTESEQVVQEALEQTMKGHTVVVIAHRLSTVKTADRIVVLDAGQIVEQGTHTELLQAKGAYANLVLRQLQSSEDVADGD